jgi:peptide/nickel transport system permease protein
MVYLFLLLFILFIGVFGETLAPYPYNEPIYANGEVLISEPPSLQHPLGTTGDGYDVLSRVLVGAKPTVITGLLGGTIIIGVGMTIGMTAGFVGGRVEDILMRFTDMVYAVPMIPFALAIVATIGLGFYRIIIVIGLVLWRANARVIRSQVLQIKERPFILAARTTGASVPSLIKTHIFPNIAPMAVLFFAIGTGQAILIQAGLAFIGVSNPFIPSWGVMIRNAFTSGNIARLWWWAVPPGLLISTTVLSLYMFGRKYEELVTGETTDESLIG